MATLTQSTAPTVFSARGVTKIYDMGEVQVHALRGVDLDLFAGEFVVLLGPSGSGKSTLLNILGGLDTPTSGHVTYGGSDLTSFDDRAFTRYRRTHVGFVFQFYNLIPSLTARENVALITDIAANPIDPGDALELVGLKERADHFPASFPAASNNASRSPGPSRSSQTCCSATNRPAPRRADGRDRARSHSTHQRTIGHDDRRHHAQRGHFRNRRSRHFALRRPRR